MKVLIAATMAAFLACVALLGVRVVRLEGRVAALEREAAAAPPATQPARADGSLPEFRERLDYLTSELAEQRADLERLRERVGAETEGSEP